MVRWSDDSEKEEKTQYKVSMSIMKHSCSLELSAWWRWTLFTKIAGVSICHGSGRAWKSTSIRVKKWWSIAYGKLPLFFLGGGMSQSPNNLLEIVASICQGCFSESALVRPKKFGESNFTPKSPTPHLRAIRTNLWSMATSLGMKAMQSPLRSMARSKNVESSSNLSKWTQTLIQPNEVAHVCWNSWRPGGSCCFSFSKAKLELGKLTLAIYKFIDRVKKSFVYMQ